MVAVIENLEEGSRGTTQAFVSERLVTILHFKFFPHFSRITTYQIHKALNYFCE
jgi:hypothetical protein